MSENHSSVIEYHSLAFLGFPKHRVGSDGSVWSKAKKWKCGEWRQLKINPWGRQWVVVLCRKRKEETWKVCYLVLLAFVGERPNGKDCCHWDDDQSNNALSNLRWDTPKNNSQDAIRNGKTLVGTRNHKAKLTEDDVRLIREIAATGEMSQLGIAHVFKMNQGTIGDLLRGLTWKHVH